MILEAVVDALLWLVTFIVDALTPDWTPLEVSDALASILPSITVVFDLLAWLDFYAPVQEFMALVLVASSLYAGAILYRLISFAASWIRGGGGNVS